MATPNLKQLAEMEAGKYYVVDRQEYHGEGLENVVAGPFDLAEDAAAARRGGRSADTTPGRFTVLACF